MSAQASSTNKKRNQGFQRLGSLFDDFKPGDSKGYITREFQDFGYRLAVELNDLEHKSLYIKMAKEELRGVLEAALSFVLDAKHAKSTARLFMWKVKELKKELNTNQQKQKRREEK